MRSRLDERPLIPDNSPVPALTPFVGRELELQRLESSLERTERGHGSLLLIAAEAGMGKTRLVEQLAELAESKGFQVHFGQCWESGGAPALWPWIQATRSLLRTAGSRPIDELSSRMRSRLAPLLPEVDPGSDGSEPAQPDQARFDLMDALSMLLSGVAARSPVVLILEDLHCADASSIALLRFMQGAVRGTRLLLVGTFRPNEVSTPPHRDLVTLYRGDALLRLDSLSKEAVQKYFDRVASESSGPADREELAQVSERFFTLTEGHPLFMAELMQLYQQFGRLPAFEALPRDVVEIIDERLDRLPSVVVDTLKRAAVLGRDVSVSALSCLKDPTSPTDSDELPHLEHAATAGLLRPLAPGSFRFSHILIREALYRRLSASLRADLHGRRARDLAQQAARDPALWFETAHHFLESSAVDSALMALERAAHTAMQRLAFDEAIALLRRARRTARLREMDDPKLGVELDLQLASALLLAGDIGEGRELCQRVAARALDTKDSALLCRAALLCGSVYVFANVDSKLVDLLETTLSVLAEDDIVRRSEVKARLAAAIQPSTSPERPIALARQAIDEARRVGDSQLLLRVIRSACSALMDLCDPRERRALNEEYIRLADEQANPSEAYRGHCRLTFDYFELGELDRARRMIAELEQRAARLEHPYYEWRAAAFRAAEATYSGRFAEAEGMWCQAESLGQRSRDPNAERAVAVGRLRLARARGDFSQLLTLCQPVEQSFRGEPFGRLLACGPLAQVGALEELRARYQPADLAQTIDAGDLQGLIEGVWIAEALEDMELAQRIRERALPDANRFVSGGMTCMTFDPPASHIVARTSHLLGDWEQAVQAYEQTLGQLQRTKGLPDLVHCAIQLGQLALQEAVLHGVLASSRRWLQVALPIARDLCMSFSVQAIEKLLEPAAAAPSHDAALADPPKPDAEERITHVSKDLSAESRRGRPPDEPPAPAGISIRAEGDLYVAHYQGQQFHLPATKGLGLLRQLLAQPHRELHVLELVSPDTRAEQGDAGPRLDATARQQYRQRILELREDIRIAEEHNDVGRCRSLHEELELLEQELHAAFGLGGRSRPNGSTAERARVNVQRRLKDAVRRISQHSPAFAEHLKRSLRTGTFCCYAPAP